MPRKQEFTLGKTVEAVLMLIVMGAGFVILFPLIAALRIGWYLRDRVADYFQPIYAIKIDRYTDYATGMPHIVHQTVLVPRNSWGEIFR